MIDKLVTMKNTKIKIARIYLDYHEKTLFVFYAVFSNANLLLKMSSPVYLIHPDIPT